MKKSLFVVLGCFLFSLIGCQSPPLPEPLLEEQTKVWTNDFIIGIIPEQNIFAQKKRYQPICDYLSKHLHYNVKTKLLESYAAIVDQMKDKKVNAGFFGSFNYTLTRAKLGIIPIARPLWLNGVSTYRGYIFTRKKSGLDLDIKKWRGKKLALVHPYTTAGYFFPRWYLFQQGVKDLESYFNRVMYTGSHDSAVLAVYNQEADLGAAKNHVYNKLIAENPKIGEDLVVLAESRAVPSNGLAVRPDTPKNLQDKLRNVLTNMDSTPEGRIILKKFGAIRFLKTTDSDYQPVRDMLAPLGVDLKTHNMKPARHQYLGEY